MKADGSVSTLKTINGNSLEGSGDIVISGGGGAELLIPNSNASSYAASTWIPSAFTSYSKIWGEAFRRNAISSDTGDIVFALRAGQYVSGSTELCIAIDGDYYAGTGQYKVLHEANVKTINGQSIVGTGNITISGGSGDYLPLTGGTITGNLAVNGNIGLGVGSNIVIGTRNTNQSFAGYISAGAGYGTSAGRYGVRLLACDQADCQSGLGQDLGSFPSGEKTGYDLSIAGCIGAQRYCHISFVTHSVNSTSYKTIGQFYVNGDTTTFSVYGNEVITGNLTVNGNNGINFGTDDDVYINRDNSRLLIINEAGDDIIIGDYDDRNYTSIVNDLQGGTTDSTYRTVTQKWLIMYDGTAYFKSVNQTSDLNKKTIMGDVPMNLYNVANAPLFKFTWKDEKKYSGQHIGSAAQYWQTVLPELVSIGRDADMTLAMQYDVIALASAITVAKTVVNHEERIILLERENEALKKEIADLKSA